MNLYYDDMSNNVVGEKDSVNNINNTHNDYHYLLVEDNDSIIWAYLPYAFFNLISSLMTVLFGYLNIKIGRSKDKKNKAFTL